METATEKYIDIPLEQLHDSPTNPRHNYDDDSMPEFVDSIRQNGIIQPLIVRPIASGYEIAAGHRRRHGAKIAGLLAVPCIIRVLSDDQIVDTHIVENIHRKDLELLDEARTYQLMLDKGATLAQVTERSGRSEGYVTRRLSLLNLIPTLQEDVAANRIPIEYGLELAKYPVDAQEAAEQYMYGEKYVLDGVDVTNGCEIFDCAKCEKISVYPLSEVEEAEEMPVCKHCGSTETQPSEAELQAEEVLDRDNLTQSLGNIRRWFTNQYLVDLSRAAFTKEDTRLRPDGLACIACPQRTGANAGLFGESEKDYCLNRDCFKGKTAAIIQITRTEKATELGVETLPLVVQHYGLSAELDLGETVKGFAEFRDYDGFEKCEFGVQVFSANDLEVQEGCLVSSGCTAHHYENRRVGESAVSSGLSAEEQAAKIAAEKRRRKEEIWNAKVGEVVRRKVLIECAKQYSEKAFQDALSKGLGPSVISRITPATIDRMWTTEDPSNKSKFIIPAIEELFGAALPVFEKSYGMGDVEITDRYEYIEGLSFEGQSMLLFLFTHGAKGAMFGNVWVDQEPVKALAATFLVNYALIDAQTRVELTTKKHEKVHKAYLQQVETKDPQAVIPILFPVDGETKAEEKPIPKPDAVQEPVSDEKGTTEPPATETEPVEPETGELEAIQEIAAASGGQIVLGSPPSLADESETACVSCGAVTDGDEVCELCKDEGVTEHDLPDEEVNEDEVCDHSDARTCEMLGHAVPEDTPALDTSFHDHEMNVGEAEGGDSDMEADELSDLFDAELAKAAE